jgi:magnesium transporter
MAARLELSEQEQDRLDKELGRANSWRAADRLHLTLEALEPADGERDRLVRREIDLVARRNLVLSVHAGQVSAVERYIDGLDGETRLGAHDAADLMSALVDEVLIGYFQIVELIERDIDDLDQRALHGRPKDDILSALVSLRRRISIARRTLAPHREALAALARPEIESDESLGQPWPGLVDRLEGALAAIDSVRDSLLGTYDIHMGRVSQHANDVMKTLTLLSGVLLPAVVLAGIMGMNFKVPFFDDAANFWIVVGSMIGMAIAILAVARWRDWI